MGPLLLLLLLLAVTLCGAGHHAELAVAEEQDRPGHQRDGAIVRGDPAVSEVDRAFVARILERHKFNISQAAQAAGMHRFELQRLIRRLKSEGTM